MFPSIFNNFHRRYQNQYSKHLCPGKVAVDGRISAGGFLDIAHSEVDNQETEVFHRG